MAIMLGKLYGALRAANVPEEQATAAAEEVAGHESQLADIRSTVRLHTWILAFNTAMLVALVSKIYRSP